MFTNYYNFFLRNFMCGFIHHDEMFGYEDTE